MFKYSGGTHCHGDTDAVFAVRRFSFLIFIIDDSLDLSNHQGGKQSVSKSQPTHGTEKCSALGNRGGRNTVTKSQGSRVGRRHLTPDYLQEAGCLLCGHKVFISL